MLAGISVVRNEADVIGATIRHHFNEGFDFLLVADNNSTDGTTALLERMAREDKRLRISGATGAFGSGCRSGWYLLGDCIRCR